jgi:hypothetical protein
MSRQRRLSRVAVVALTLKASGKALLPAAARASSRISYLPPPGPVVVFDLFESRQSVTISRRWTRCSASLLRRRSTSSRRKEWSLTTAPTCPPGGFPRKQRPDRDRLGLRNHAWCQPGTRHRTRRPHQPGVATWVPHPAPVPSRHRRAATVFRRCHCPPAPGSQPGYGARPGAPAASADSAGWWPSLRATQTAPGLGSGQ